MSARAAGRLWAGAAPRSHSPGWAGRPVPVPVNRACGGRRPGSARRLPLAARVPSEAHQAHQSRFEPLDLREESALARSLRRLVFVGLAGVVSLSTVVLLLWEVAFHVLGVAGGRDVQWPFLARGFSTALLVACFAAAFFWQGRRRLDAGWETLRRRRAELDEQELREEDALGLAALSRALAHELRGPLHVISLRAAMVRKAARPLRGGARLVELAREIEAEVARTDSRLQGYIGAAGDFTRDLRREPVDLAALLGAAAARLAPLARARDVKLEFSPEGGRGPDVIGDPRLLQRALRVLLRGALEAAPPGTTVGLRTSVTDGAAVLSLWHGRGANAAALFGTAGEPAAARAALGLALVRDVARAHGGELVAPGAGAGASVALKLPVGP